MKNTGKKWKKNKQRKTRKQLPIIQITRGGAWYSAFLPFFGNPGDKPSSIEVEKPVVAEGKLKQTEVEKTQKQSEDKAIKTDNKPINVEEQSTKTDNKPKKVEEKPSKKGKYELKSDETTMDKEFFDNPNISINAFDDPNYEKVGIVHVTSVVGVNVLRSYSTTVVNVLGKKGVIDENMHQLRNEMFLEMENVMKEKNIDKIENVQVAFTKDSGTLILNGFGTALRKKQI
jgi:uncharacterized protein YbjQ (UPF0145 family)